MAKNPDWLFIKMADNMRAKLFKIYTIEQQLFEAIEEEKKKKLCGINLHEFNQINIKSLMQQYSTISI